MEPEQFITVEIPGIGEAEFPASMPPDQIASEAHRLWEDGVRTAARAVPSPEQNTPKSFGGFVANTFEDAGRVGSALNPMNWPGMVSGALESKRQTEAGFENAVRNPEQAYSQPGDRLAAGIQKLPGIIYQQPVQSALELAPVVGPAGKAAVNTVRAHPHIAASAAGAVAGGIAGGPMGALQGATGGVTSRLLKGLADRFGSQSKPTPSVPDSMGLATPEAIAARQAAAVQPRSAVVPERVRQGSLPQAELSARAQGEAMMSPEAAAMREAMSVDGPGTVPQRGRTGSMPVQESLASQGESLLSPMAAHARQINAVEGAPRGVLDNPRVRGGGPPVSPPKPPNPNAGGVLRPGSTPSVESSLQTALDDLVKPQPSHATVPPAAPGGDAMRTVEANQNVIRQMRPQPSHTPAMVAAKPTPKAAPKPAPGVVAETPSPNLHQSKSKTARGGHVMSENDKKVLAENIRKGMDDDAAWVDMVAQSKARGAANYANAKAVADARKAGKQ